MSNQKPIRNQEIFKAFKSNTKDRYWKEKITALGGVILIVTVLIFSLKYCSKSSVNLNFDVQLVGNIGENNNIGMFLKSRDGILSGFYFDKSINRDKYIIDGTLYSDGKFNIKDYGILGNYSASFIGFMLADGSIQGEWVDNENNNRMKFKLEKSTTPFSNWDDIDSKTDVKTVLSPQPQVPPLSSPQTQSFVVSGKNLKEFADNIKNKSALIMSRNRYNVINAKIDLPNYNFSCDLVPDPNSEFFKIGLYFGPSNIGYCESCQAVLQKNTGSVEIISDSNPKTMNDGTSYYYSVIAIHR